MPPRNEDWKIAEFDKLQLQTIELLRRKAEQHDQDIAVIKVKIALVAGGIGAAGGVAGSLLTAAILYWLKLK
jgi:hypothetical protein